MNRCEKCKKAIMDGEERSHHGKSLCEDCLIDVLLPPVKKMYYDNDASGFMVRLKDSYIAHPQKYH